MKSLTKKQLNVIDDLFAADGDAVVVMKKHRLSSGLLRRWLSDKNFNDEIAFRLDSARQQSRILLAKYIPLASAKLVELCASEKAEIARRACLDILSLPSERSADESDNADDEKSSSSGRFSPQLAAKLLAVLAENKTLP